MCWLLVGSAFGQWIASNEDCPGNSANSIISSVVTPLASGMPATLLSVSNVWRFNTNGMDLGSDWRNYAYDDTNWASGAGVFAVGATLPSGTFANTTLPLKNTNNIVLNTIYFRAHFTYYDDPTCLQVIVSNLVDDGAVFYLNGQEIQRLNIASGPVNYSTSASSVIANPVWKFFLISPYLLQPGDNVLAVEVHQVNTTSVDLVFGLKISSSNLTASALTITNQPQNLIVQEGQNARFTVGVSGNCGQYQWYKDGFPIFGATLNFLTISNVTAADAVNYLVTVSNTFSFAVSSNAALVITNIPFFISSQPQSRTNAPGTTATFSVAVSNNVANISPQYQWLKDGSILTGATSPTLSFPVWSHTNAGSYSVIVSNLGYAASSSVASLEVQISFTRAPYLQNATTNGIVVVWRTDAPASTIVEYGPTEALGATIIDTVLASNHVSVLSGLEPGKRYFYRARSIFESLSIESPIASFRTLKPSGSILFGVLGATNQRQTNAPQPLLAQALQNEDVDLVIHTGDISTVNLDAFFGYFQTHTRNAPYYYCFGNNDPTNLQNPIFLPDNSGSQYYYSFDHGDVHFVCVYTPGRISDLQVGTAQYTWLTNDLSQSTKPWKLLFGHLPVASSAGGIMELLYLPESMALLLPAATNYGVQMIFGGHNRVFERFVPTNGTHHCVVGPCDSYAMTISTTNWASAQAWGMNSCLRIGITNDTLTLQALDTNGMVFDSMTVQKSLPAPRIYEGPINTPQMPTGLATDGDGNILGQTFDLTGEPILARSGQQSDLGRLRVNYDSTNLYLGFDQVMILRNENVFLFLEVPNMPGVSTMAGLGNGIIDPEEQGADGLDCLENLSFLNFHPAIGCILGDEYADGQYRSFARSNLALNIGQGVYYLYSDLPDVPGVQLQQFNRSPQTAPHPLSDTATNEQNADFIEIAIPFSALGGLQSGDIIKVGAVVGGWDFDPVAQTRFIDTSVLGYSLSGSGQDNVVLEGLSVRLSFSAIQVNVTRLPDNQIRLSWNAVVGKKHTIESCEVLPNFQTIDDPNFPRTATATTETYDVTLPASGTGFYRVRVVP